MVVHKRKKLSRYRGSYTHGAGSKKKRRGAGNRGGRGMAGTGKRADSKKPSIWRNTKYFGKHGFKRSMADPPRELTISALRRMIPRLVESGIAVKDKDAFSVDISALGYDKLLAKGKLDMKLNLKVKYASRGAVTKVEAAGGNITLTEVPDAAAPAAEAASTAE